MHTCFFPSKVRPLEAEKGHLSCTSGMRARTARFTVQDMMTEIIVDLLGSSGTDNVRMLDLVVASLSSSLSIIPKQGG